MLRKNAESSTSSSDFGPPDTGASLRRNQSWNASGRVSDVDDLGGLAADHRAAERAGSLARHFDVQPVLDDVDDLVDCESHRAAAIREHQERLRTLGAQGELVLEPHQGHQLSAILHQVAA